jgi:hypothetical protein
MPHVSFASTSIFKARLKMKSRETSNCFHDLGNVQRSRFKLYSLFPILPYLRGSYAVLNPSQLYAF